LQTIGLAFVHELVRLHGGDVRVSHQEGQPSTFKISIPPGARAQSPSAQLDARGPMANAAATALQQALRWLPDESLRRALEPTLAAQQPAPGELPWPERMRPGPSEGRILLAEDNAELRTYVEQLLSERWTVEASADGASALEVARERPPDLVLADIMMPGIDGLTLVRALRANPPTATTPILLLSAQAGREARMEGELAGADDYLVKPFSARELIARVALHLEIGRVRTQLGHTRQAASERERLHAELLGELTSAARTLQEAASATAASATAGGSADARALPLELLEREAARLTSLAERLQGPASGKSQPAQ
jgi:DNA-binding response OmpR family regulator